MQSPLQHSRINLAELKAQLVRKLGPERSKLYFYYLNRLLRLKLSKVEFNKLCVRILGRENVPLHNQFIRSILKNACSAKVPPSTHDNEVLKPTTEIGEKETLNDNYQQNGSHASTTQASSSPGLSNGDILPVSPRKARTAFRDRRDRRSALGQNGKTNSASQRLTTPHSSDASLENGALSPIDIQRPVQHSHGLTLQSDNEKEASGHHSAKFSVIQRSPDGLASIHSAEQTNISDREDQRDLYARSPLRAPLGVPFCPVSVGGARKALPAPTTSNCVSASACGALLDSLTLRERMEQIAISQGLEGVSIDCANLLNKGLDAYLKGIIKSCVGVVGARWGHEPAKTSTKKPQAYMNLVNGVRTDNHFQMQRSRRPLDVMDEHPTSCPISLQDFRVAMELNPQQLGEDWPLLLERICINSFEE